VRAILGLLATYGDEQGRVPGPVSLSARVLEQLVGQRRVMAADGRKRRASAVAIEELERLGILAVHADYSVGRHARLYTCWYQFGSGALPARDPELGLVLATRSVEEGVLAVVGGVVDEPPVCRFVSFRTGLVAALDSWWQRMYARRAFTPAEFYEADRRQVLPGPFRHRRLSAAVKVPDQPDGGRADAPPCPAVAERRSAPPPGPGGLGALAAPPASSDLAQDSARQAPAMTPEPASTEATPATTCPPVRSGVDVGDRGRPTRRSWDTDEVYALRVAIVEAEQAGDQETARRLAMALFTLLRVQRSS
jgi:hypothetical protein